MTPDGNLLLLPKEPLANYAQVKKCLLTAGGKYLQGSKFQFPEDAATIQQRLVGGEAIDANAEGKELQYFPTPHALAERMIYMAGVRDGMRVLEPSAGQGHIAKIMHEKGVKVTCVEIMDQNVQALRRTDYENIIAGDFLALDPSDFELFDAIVANPPFSKGRDMQHVRHMYEFLKPGGFLVTVMFPSWEYKQQKAAQEFRNWFDSVAGKREELPEGTFKESGTMTRTLLVTIRKPIV